MRTMLNGLSLSNRHKRGLEFELNLVHSTRVAILIATDWQQSDRG